MAIVSAEWAEAMLPIIDEIYTLTERKEKDYIKEIAGRSPSKFNSERTLGVGSRGYMKEWNSVGRTAAGALQDVSKGWQTTYTHKKYADMAAVERDWMDDEEYERITREVQDLRTGGYRTQQFHFSELFNTAWSGESATLGDLTLADGYPLASASHTYNEAGSGGTFSNSYTSRALTPDNLEYIRTQMVTAWKDDKGNLLNIDPDDLVLLVPSALRKMALTIADSDLEPDTTDNNVNVWKGSIDVIEWPRLTDSTAWFVISRSQARKLLHWYDRRPLGLNKFVDNYSEQILSTLIGRWSLGSDCAPAWVACAKA